MDIQAKKERMERLLEDMLKLKPANKKSRQAPRILSGELLTFNHQVIRAKSMDGDDFIIKADSIVAIKKGGEEDGKPYTFVYAELGGKRFVAEGDEKQVAAKLNWVIED